MPVYVALLPKPLCWMSMYRAVLCGALAAAALQRELSGMNAAAYAAAYHVETPACYPCCCRCPCMPACVALLPKPLCAESASSSRIQC